MMRLESRKEAEMKAGEISKSLLLETSTCMETAGRIVGLQWSHPNAGVDAVE